MISVPTVPALVAKVAFAGDLATHGDNVALITARETVSYQDLAARVGTVVTGLRGGRRLVLVVGSNTVESVVAYLGALAGGHVVLLVPDDKPATVAALIARYDPDVVMGAGGRPIDERRPGSVHTLHPDLALLLSTSGSTGSSKLVRLSRENLNANAEAIATYLGIRATDRAATTLPLSYCYGLSVVNSHLLRGAALIVTDHSVADTGFWDLFREHGGTSFAGVPYTFDLLDRVGFDAMPLPRLRYVTQAGGRMAPERVRRYAAAGRERGWDLFVMYGQTEATARMAYLPPELALEHPGCIGVPIPGGSFRLEPLPDWPDADTGELVYAGPNVMLGYAEGPADLSLGRTAPELPTGDIARRTGEGLYEIVGRRGRFLKLFGLRIDLQRVEETLAEQGFVASAVGDDSELVIALVDEAGGRHRARAATDRAERVRRAVAQACGLPARVIRVHVLADLPRLANGKPDYAAVRALTAGPTPADARADGPADDRTAPTDLRALYAEVLGVRDVSADSTFVSLGGDSLSYVAMSVRLEQALGHLPRDWHTTPIRDLRPAGRPPTRRRALDTSVFLRALSIVLIVGQHVSLDTIEGGAHILLGVAGYNFARFQLTSAERPDRVRHILSSLSRIVIPSVIWIAIAVLATDDYALPNVFLVNDLFGSPSRDDVWDFWFIESLVYILVGMVFLVGLPWADRLERRYPFAFPLSLMSLGLAARFRWHLDPAVANFRVTPITVFWLFALGWLGARATTRTRRLFVTATILVTVFGWFGDLQREALIVAGLILLVWLPTIPSTRLANRVAGLLAGGSLYIYLTHWQVFPRLDRYSLVLATVGSLVAGIGYGKLFTDVLARIPARLRRLLRPGAHRAPDHDRAAGVTTVAAADR